MAFSILALQLLFQTIDYYDYRVLKSAKNNLPAKSCRMPITLSLVAISMLKKHPAATHCKLQSAQSPSPGTMAGRNPALMTSSMNCFFKCSVARWSMALFFKSSSLSSAFALIASWARRMRPSCFVFSFSTNPSQSSPAWTRGYNGMKWFNSEKAPREKSPFIMAMTHVVAWDGSGWHGPWKSATPSVTSLKMSNRDRRTGGPIFSLS